MTKKISAFVVTVDEVKAALVDFYTEIITTDEANTRTLIAQPGGIGEAVPDIANMTENEVAEKITHDFPNLHEKWFEENPDCDIILIQLSSGAHKSIVSRLY